MDKRLIDFLESHKCPYCGGDLGLSLEGKGYVCEKCGRKYPRRKAKLKEVIKW